MCSHLLCVSLWILNINQNFSQSSLHCLHQKLCWFQDNVTARFDTWETKRPIRFLTSHNNRLTNKQTHTPTHPAAGSWFSLEADNIRFKLISLWTDFDSEFPLTWSVSFGPLRVQCLGPQGGAGLQFRFGELGQVGHHRVLVHVRIHDLFWSDHLKKNEEEITW